MDILLSVLVPVILVFLGLRVVFAFLAWFFPEADKVHRQQLDSLYDTLTTYSLFQLSHIVLKRFVAKLDKLAAMGFQFL